MFAVVEQLPRDFEMAVRRRGDRSRIDPRREIFQRRRRDRAEFLRELLRLLAIGVVERGEFRVLEVVIEPRVVLADVANPDDANAQLAHQADTAAVSSSWLTKPIVGPRNAVAQRNLRPPVHRAELRHIEQLARCAVRLGRVKRQLAFEPDDIADQLRQLADRNIFAASDVHDLRRIMVLEQEHTRVGHVVDVQKFAPRIARPPDDELARAIYLRLVRLPQQRREHVRREQIEVVVRAVEIRRHRADVVLAILARVGLAKADAGDLRDRVGIVRRLERARSAARFPESAAVRASGKCRSCRGKAACARYSHARR